MTDLKAAQHHPHDTSVTDLPSCNLRPVSTPEYSGIERRSRPRFIEVDLNELRAALRADQLNNGENMKPYTTVVRPDSDSIHILFDGDIATACGAISKPELVPAPPGKVTSCDACTKAMLNQQRASDRRLPPPQPKINASVNVLASVQDIIDNCPSRMVGDGSGEREYVLSQSDIDTLRGLRDAFIAETIIAAQKIVNDADLLGMLRQMCGYVENGSSESVTIAQDDATNEWSIYIGDSLARSRGTARRYHSTSFHQAIRVAAEKELSEEEPQAHGYADQDEGNLMQPRDVKFEKQIIAADAVVEANRKLLLDRSNVGIQKYGVTLEQSGLTQRQFIQHALEETLDLANYLQATLMQAPQ